MPAMLMILGCAAMLLGQFLVYFYAPMEATMGLAQKIFYIHLPLAWWALVSFFIVFCASIGYLVKKKRKLDLLAGAAAETGVLFSGLALITGMIWARHSWGVWWTWDPRLSTTLVMWFIYAAYLVFRGLDLPDTKKRTLCAALGIFAFLDVPLVFFSARLFRSIHPAVFAKQGGLEPEMLHAAIGSSIALGLFWCGLLLFRARQLSMQAQINDFMTRGMNS